MARKPGNGMTVLLWLVMFVVLGIAGTEFYGPFRGWIRPTVSDVRGKATDFQKEYAQKQERNRRIAEAMAREASYENPFTILQGDNTAFEDQTKDPVEPGTTDPADPKPTTQPAAVTTKGFNPKSIIEKYPPEHLIPTNPGYQTIYEEVWKGKVAELENPEVGKPYKIRTKDRGIIEGNLLVYSPDRLVLKDDQENDYSIDAHNLSMGSLKKMFPERYSKKFAQYHMAKALRASGIEVPKPKPIPTTPSTVAGTKPPTVTPGGPNTDMTAPRPPDQPQPSTLTNYDPSYAPTPRHLAAPIKEFHAWLDYQNRRLKWRLATKLYAKDYGGDIVLYLETSKSFRMQDKETRQVYCDSFWRMWSRKLKEQGRVPDEKFAHLVLVDDRGNIVGGSKLKDSANIWVK